MEADVIVSFISVPLKDIMMSLEALTTVESLEKRKQSNKFQFIPLDNPIWIILV